MDTALSAAQVVVAIGMASLGLYMTINPVVPDRPWTRYNVRESRVYIGIFAALAIVSFAITIWQGHRTQAAGVELDRARVASDAKLDKLIADNASLRDELQPFKRIAEERYPGLSSSASAQRLEQELAAVRELASQPALVVQRLSPARCVVGGIAASIDLVPSKDAPMGPITIDVTLTPPEGPATIVELSPAQGQQRDATVIDDDGKHARFTFYPFGSPRVHLVVSRPSTAVVFGSHGISNARIEIEEPPGGCPPKQ